MEKPKRPKKPTPPNIREPEEEIIEHYYPFDTYISPATSCQTRLEYIHSSNLPDIDEWTDEVQDWYDEHSAKSNLSLQQLVDFAMEYNISLDKVQVGSIIPHRDSEDTELELVVKRRRSNEELSEARAQYNEAMAAYNAKLSEYEEAKASYPRRKAEYELWLAQEKLNALQ